MKGKPTDNVDKSARHSTEKDSNISKQRRMNPLYVYVVYMI